MEEATSDVVFHPPTQEEQRDRVLREIKDAEAELDAAGFSKKRQLKRMLETLRLELKGHEEMIAAASDRGAIAPAVEPMNVSTSPRQVELGESTEVPAAPPSTPEPEQAAASADSPFVARPDGLLTQYQRPGFDIKSDPSIVIFVEGSRYRATSSGPVYGDYVGFRELEARHDGGDGIQERTVEKPSTVTLDGEHETKFNLIIARWQTNIDKTWTRFVNRFDAQGRLLATVKSDGCSSNYSFDDGHVSELTTYQYDDAEKVATRTNYTPTDQVNDTGNELWLRKASEYDYHNLWKEDGTLSINTPTREYRQHQVS